MELWEAFAPAIRARAWELVRPDLFQFGEVADHTGDTALMSEFTTTGNLDAVLDFGFYDGARDFVSRGHDASALAAMFERDAWYTGPGSNAQEPRRSSATTTTGGSAISSRSTTRRPTRAGWESSSCSAKELLLTVRGQPVIYYGDEQGMVGIGNDMGAREDMFASRAPAFRDL